MKGPEYSSENKKICIFFWTKKNSKTRKPRKNSELQVKTELKTLSSDARTSELLWATTPVIEDFTSWIGDLLETLTA